MKQSALARTLIVLVALFALIVAVLSISYLYLPAADMRFVQQRAAFAEALWAIRLHAAGGILALLLGPLQFVTAIRTRRPGVHRWLGRCYLAAIAIGAIGAFGLAPSAFGGVVSTFGFSFLAAAWIGSAATAYRCIRVRDIDAHRRWMMRTFALTFAAVSLRIELPILMAIGLEHESAYRTVAWLSWLPNLVVMEFWLCREKSRAST